MDNDLIISMNKTPVFFNPEINGVIVPKGEHSVVYKTQSKEKHKYTLVISITAIRRKIKPLIIIKGNYSD